MIKVGDGRRTSFWLDKWLGDVVLAELFPRLFSLAIDKEDGSLLLLMLRDGQDMQACGAIGMALNSLFVFLVERPSQLKYIEWPNFQSTLKTASLTLVLVALLIVALSSVHSALSYLLALLLRRTP
ncbi:hypothetical protein F0562_018744 [Nyssa sinensis]|uniref:Uncharacterized protein n=1 Tax=Nyssa sinensis TaxID=561372 RepID=A0A5J4ZAP0_9ASTE|nr:hypothetical protein F0562_018744 [Nyssa sinensis]